MKNNRVAFVGGGNMTQAIIGGLLQADYPASDILVAEPSAEQREKLARSAPGIFIVADNNSVVAPADSVVLAVKPQIIAMVCRKLSPAVQKHRPLIISIAAGPRIDDIDVWLGGGNAIIRVMPNQPALIRKGISGLYANDATTGDHLDTALAIMSAVGAVIAVPNEKDIDAVTAISGSGPAYFYLLIDMLVKAGRKFGLNDSSARQLAVETALGAATLAQGSDATMDELISGIRSPAGTTAAALDSLEENGVRDIFSAALAAARDRATELADMAHEDSQD